MAIYFTITTSSSVITTSALQPTIEVQFQQQKSNTSDKSLPKNSSSPKKTISNGPPLKIHQRWSQRWGWSLQSLYVQRDVLQRCNCGAMWIFPLHQCQRGPVQQHPRRGRRPWLRSWVGICEHFFKWIYRWENKLKRDNKYRRKRTRTWKMQSESEWYAASYLYIDHPQSAMNEEYRMYIPHRVWHATNYPSQNASKHRPTHGCDSIEVPNLQQCVHHAQALPTIGFTQKDDVGIYCLIQSIAWL